MVHDERQNEIYRKVASLDDTVLTSTTHKLLPSLFLHFWNFGHTMNKYVHFTFCWPRISLWFLVNDHTDAQFFSIYLFQSSTCFQQPCAHHQENQLYQYNLWYMSLCVGDRFVCRSERNSFPDLHTKRPRTQSDIYQRLYWYNWFSWWWARVCSKHVENWNKYIEKNCASSWSFTKNHKEMHGQRNKKH